MIYVTVDHVSAIDAPNGHSTQNSWPLAEARLAEQCKSGHGSWFPVKDRKQSVMLRHNDEKEGAEDASEEEAVGNGGHFSIGILVDRTWPGLTNRIDGPVQQGADCRRRHRRIDISILIIVGKGPTGCLKIFSRVAFPSQGMRVLAKLCNVEMSP